MPSFDARFLTDRINFRLLNGGIREPGANLVLSALQQLVNMDSFEPMLKKSRGYDTDGANGMPWTSSGGNMNANTNPGVNLSSGVNYHSGPNPNPGHGFNLNAAGANPNPNPSANPNPAVNEVIPGPPQGGYPPAMGGGSYGGGSGGSYGGGSYGGGSYENGNHSTHFEGSGFQQQQQQGSNVNGNDLECRRYKTQDGCPYGVNCRFRHGPTDERETGNHNPSSGGKTKPCMKFFSTSGCPYGESCHFLHYVAGGITALGLAPVQTMPATTMAPPRKHSGPTVDPNAMVGSYKTRLCNRFNTPEGCRFGDKCHFAHGESDLRSSNNIRVSNRNGVPMQPASAMYDNGPPATVSNPAVFVDTNAYGNQAPTNAYGNPATTNAYGNSASTTAYGNSAVYSGNTFPSSQSYAEPTPPGVAANTTFVANYSMPVENSSQLAGVEGTMQAGPATGTNNVQVY